MEKRIEPLADVAEYYAAKLAAHGATPRGVDWNGAESQVIRFEQLLKLVDSKLGFSINDLGCGYGALMDYLKDRFDDFSYTGFDVAESMLATAKQRFAGEARCRFLLGAAPSATADFGVASGIFNVRLTHGIAEWRRHVEAVLDSIDKSSRRGFAFNCLTSYSDPDKVRGDLYYADPCEMFDFCKRRYASDVALLHDYGHYEFTIHVRKEA